jgi:hypothetical protein
MGDQDLLSIAIGHLDEPARVRPTFHQCVSAKLPWLEIDDGLPRFSENTITHPSKRMSPIGRGIVKERLPFQSSEPETAYQEHISDDCERVVRAVPAVSVITPPSAGSTRPAASPAPR